MKIDNSIKGLAPRPNTTPNRPTEVSGKGVTSSGLQVDLSATAKLQQGGASSGANPAFNAERVAEIRQAISEGRFQVNPEKIADGLLDSVREMLSQRRRPA